MPLYIKDREVHAMAQRVATARNTTVTEAVRRALEREVAEIDGERGERDRRMRALFARWDMELPVEPWDDAEMYDEDGVPR